MSVQITEQDFYDMRNQRDAERTKNLALQIELARLTAFNESMQTDARKNTETIREIKGIAANLARHLESINHIAERGANIAPRMTKEIRKHCEAANVMEAL